MTYVVCKIAGDAFGSLLNAEIVSEHGGSLPEAFAARVRLGGVEHRIARLTDRGKPVALDHREKGDLSHLFMEYDRAEREAA